MSGKDFKFTGHETFACRYAWLPKAVRHVASDPSLFSDVENAMVCLGVGKNMVQSIRFWAEAADVIQPADMSKDYRVSPFGTEMLGHDGHDPFMEDERTLWLIHWKLATNPSFRVFAWDYFLNHWQEPELSASTVLAAIQRHVKGLPRESPSDTVLEQQFEIFLHSYMPTRSKKKGVVREDNLDCPLVELQLLQEVGVRRTTALQNDRVESVYAFRRESKKGITPGLFAYCLDDFWRTWHPDEKTLAYPLLLHGQCGPGQVFKLPEADVRARCESLERDTNRWFKFQESALQPVIVRTVVPDIRYPLARVYGGSDE